jgi:hypothetical protein
MTEEAALKIPEIVAKYAPKKHREVNGGGEPDPAPGAVDLHTSRVDALVGNVSLSALDAMRQHRDTADEFMRALTEETNHVRALVKHLGEVSSSVLAAKDSMDETLKSLQSLMKAAPAVTVLPPASLLPKTN